MAIVNRDPHDGLPGNIRPCRNCEYQIMFTDLGWLHIDTHGLKTCLSPGPILIKKEN